VNFCGRIPVKFSGAVSCRYLDVLCFHLLLSLCVCDQLEGEAKWFMTAGEYFMIFTVTAGREEIEDL
jgi:hypothetical protein